MGINFMISLFLRLGLMGSSLHAADDNPIFKSVKYGIFAHHAWGGTAYDLLQKPKSRTGMRCCAELPAMGDAWLATPPLSISTAPTFVGLADHRDAAYYSHRGTCASQ